MEKRERKMKKAKKKAKKKEELFKIANIRIENGVMKLHLLEKVK